MRLVDISDRSVRRLARTGVGEGGQYFTGIGFADGHLGWVSGWLVGGGAVRPGIYRYRLSTGKLSRAPLPRDYRSYIVALALWVADGAYLLDGDPTSDGGCDPVAAGSDVVSRCYLIRSEPLPPPRTRLTSTGRMRATSSTAGPASTPQSSTGTASSTRVRETTSPRPKPAAST